MNILRDTGYLDKFLEYGDTMLSEFGILAIFILGICDIFQNNQWDMGYWAFQGLNFVFYYNNIKQFEDVGSGPIQAV